MTDIVAKLKSPATIFYEYAADKGELLREAADTIEALRAENARLQILLDGRDLFIVENGLWRQFVDDADRLKIRAEAARAAMGETE